MEYPDLNTLVESRLQDAIDGPSSTSKPVSVRLSVRTIAISDVLLDELGYSTRSEFFRDLVETSIHDVMTNVVEALGSSSDPSDRAHFLHRLTDAQNTAS